MIPLKRLILVAGFEGGDVESQITSLQRRFESGSVRFLARRFPADPVKRVGYLRELVRAANEMIFGPDGATNFCRRLDQPCAIEAREAKLKGKTCDHRQLKVTACARGRPQLIVVLCADHLFEEVFGRLGRAALILRLERPQLPSVDELKKLIDAFEPIAAQVVLTVANRDKSLYAPLVPDRNFQRLGHHPIAAAIQAAPDQIATIFAKYHNELYRSDFKNPVKPQIRGAYMLDDETAFQEDRLHNTTQIIGDESRNDGFHLLNAYHVYGVKVDPGFHFDVMSVGGGAIGQVLTDVLTGNSASAAEEHLNATPCDRLV
jgi:hypothetical protein